MSRPIDGPRGDQEEDGVDEHHHHAGQVEVDADSLVLQETLLLPDPRLDEVDCVEDVEVVSEDDEESEEKAGAPADQGVEQELGQGRTTTGNFCLEECPAEIETHNRHPTEHGEGEKVSGVSWCRKLYYIINNIHSDTICMEIAGELRTSYSQQLDLG